MNALVCDRSHWRLLSLLVVAAVLATEPLTQRGFAHAMFYIPCVLMAALTEERRWLLGVTVASLVLAAAGLVLSPAAPADFPPWQVLGDRLGSMVIIVAAAGFAWYHLVLKLRATAARERQAQTSASLQHSDALVEIAS